MALKELNRLCDDARRKFTNIERIAICHRLGLAFNNYTLKEKTVIYSSGKLMLIIFN